jgi:hypothetical protein
MTLGAGKYDDELTEARRKCGANSAVLIVIDGKRGPGFACQTTVEHLAGLPEMLEFIAVQLRADRARMRGDA